MLEAIVILLKRNQVDVIAEAIAEVLAQVEVVNNNEKRHILYYYMSFLLLKFISFIILFPINGLFIL